MQQNTHLLGADGSRFPEDGGLGAGVALVDAGGDLWEGDVGAGDGEGEEGRGWRIDVEIDLLRRCTVMCYIVFPSCSYSIAK